ncbi:MAG: glycosyltransferase family 4 protein [Pseudomonadota bacterium]
MKLLIITSIFPPEIGGPATYTYEIAQRFKKKHQIRVLTLTENPIRIDGVDIFTACLPIFSKKEQLLYRVARFLGTYSTMFLYLVKNYRKYDLVYVQSPDYLGFMSTIFAKVLRKPIVLKFVGDTAWENASRERHTSKLLDEFLESPEGGLSTNLMLHIQRFVFRHVKKIVTPSQYLGNVLMTYYRVNSKKIEVIPNAVELADYEKPITSAKLDYGKPVICTIGRLVPWKGIDRIISIIPKLVKKYPELTLLVIGDGPERQNLEKLAREISIDKHITFPGVMEHEKVIDILRISDVFVLNSTYEGLPHVVIEAMACKTPVIATGIKGTDEVVKNKETGLLTDIDNEQGLLDKLTYVFENNKEIRNLAETAYRNIRDNFTWNKTLQELESLLEKTI